MALFKFTDCKDREWDVEMTLGAARRIDAADLTAVTQVPCGGVLHPEATKDTEPYSILDLHEALMVEIASNRSLRIAMLYAILAPQVEEKMGIDPKEQPEEASEKFCDGLDAKALEAADRAFWETLADFHHERATILSSFAENEREARRLAREEIALRAPAVQKEMQRQLRKSVKEAAAEYDRLFPPTDENSTKPGKPST